MASTLTARVGVIGSIWAEVAELAENPLVQRVISVFDKVEPQSGWEEEVDGGDDFL